ncbi:MAG TPA: ArsR family transcriptional regulator [Nocardioides sp.]|uniref:HVO_A0114 family putative DNA-binding protein n=1 Tax=Nocardioides sp. TaxID=35761 RepID=UPI002ED9A647
MSKSAAPPLMAIFRSQLQGELLARLLLAPEQTSISDLARDLGAPFATVHREVERLIRADLVQATQVGRTRVLRVNADNLAYRPLRDLVLLTFGPRQVIDEEFGELAGLEGLYIFGSWAARYRGEDGPQPNDIDVLVVGEVDRDDVCDCADRAQRRLQRPVNPTVVSRARWLEAGEPFLNQLRRRPLVQLVPAPSTEGDTNTDVRRS